MRPVLFLFFFLSIFCFFVCSALVKLRCSLLRNNHWHNLLLRISQKITKKIVKFTCFLPIYSPNQSAINHLFQQTYDHHIIRYYSLIYELYMLSANESVDICEIVILFNKLKNVPFGEAVGLYKLQNTTFFMCHKLNRPSFTVFLHRCRLLHIVTS